MKVHFLSLLAALLVCLCSASAAPYPFVKKNPHHNRVPPGKWLLHFGGTTYNMALRDDGTMVQSQTNNTGLVWTGTWKYENGIFAILETNDPSNVNAWKWWYLKLDDKLSGVTTSDSSYPNISIRLEKMPEK